ncbi:branched-chain amino acid ABC transporter permease [Caldilinea sp.]|uniref:branched-chain amino acid ABC transporter permease n=1 Tax=Caldilinea sp. TaxID=2293560 RepID=UPI0021DEB46D|nr:branched-chain amino acid ABC transporter permease [Caldilinea sp.]GIV67240.1 MAG: branched-chain amino acid ABC transporter permease [Caldilinea sp.]
MRLRRVNPIKEILRPLGQLLIFVIGSAVIISAFVLLLALLLRPTRTDIDIFQVSLILLPQVLIDGITLGFMYAIIAMGYTMVYGVLEFINFAHGEFVMFGAFAGVELLIWLNAQGVLRTSEMWLALLWLVLAVLLGMSVGGALAVSAERFAYRPLRGTPRLVPLIAAIGVSFLLQDTMRFLQSAINGDFYRTFPEFGPFAQRLTLFSLSIDERPINIAVQYKAILLISFAIIMLVALNYLVNATRLGKAIRSVAQDQRTASLMGIDVNRIIALTFLIGGAMGGAAGVLWTFRFTRADPYMGFIPGLKAFTAAVLGGIGSIVGAMLGGMVLGLLESFAASYFSIFSRGAFGAEYKDIFAFGILILVLIFRPQGLLGGKTTQKA